MRGMLARFVPDGLAARFALLLACALIVANLVALAVLSLERDRLGREAREDRGIARIVALVPALEAVDPLRRRAVARDASTRFARIRIGSAPLVDATLKTTRARALEAGLKQSLGERAVNVGILDRNSARPAVRREPPRRWRRQETIAFSIALTTAGEPEWLNVTTRGPRRGPSGDGGRVFFLALALSLAAVLGVGLWFVRRLTRPLGDLATAARAAGRGDRTAQVPEEGAREMREAAIAFNAMQEQIAGFEAERMRTLAAVGHDLRTPITSLRIRAEMLEDDVRDPIVHTLDEMTVMADELVAFARGDAEAEERKAVDLASLLGRVCEDRGASLSVMEAITVSARPVALTRAFGNLIDNAIRYGGSARVTLSRDGDEVTLTVDDDGPGIPSDRLQEMFEPFVRGEASRNTETGGAGLGLSIVRQVVRSHGGTVTLANRENGGLCAMIRLPI